MPPLSTLSKEQLRDRIRGCLIGSAVGDAYGLATEFMSTPMATKFYGNGPIAFGREPGYPVLKDSHRLESDRNDFTDDTDQMLVILQSLDQVGDGKLHPVNFAKRLYEWRDYGIPELGTDPGRGLGCTVGSVLHHPMFQSNPHFAAFDIWDSAGRNLAPNGAVMRTAVVGVESFWDESRVVENSMAAAKVTHCDPRSVLSALISSVLISRLLRGGGVDEAHDNAQAWNPKLSEPAYRQELIMYLERGTDLGDRQSMNPQYDAENSISRFQPKDYEALSLQRLGKEATVIRSHQIYESRPKVVLRSDIGWAGIDNVGEDKAMGSLARSVVADYKFLIQQTNVAPPSDQAGERIQDRWAEELEAHCFPQNMKELSLGDSRSIGYTFKCIGIAYYGATRREDPSPTSPEYGGPAGLFRGLMEQVTLQGGDADTNDAVLGSLLGARFGLESGIPLGWWSELQHLQWLNETIDKYTQRVLDNYDAHQ
ncbi:hypothetical protein BGX21_002886 [Mortierella sp. AD011]|nr:hypothetical protein BGX20_006340 [Mortierella sp. AD010]KAF9378536.1 hypothetical protein BGX21_002886 [Mortierella sp. AD011]